MLTHPVSEPFKGAASYTELDLFNEVKALLSYISRHYQRQDVATFVDLKDEERDATLRIYSTDVPEGADSDYEAPEYDELLIECSAYHGEVCIDHSYWRPSQRDECLAAIMASALANLNSCEQRHLQTAFIAAPHLPQTMRGAAP